MVLRPRPDREPEEPEDLEIVVLAIAGLLLLMVGVCLFVSRFRP